jgi:transposase-like protein
MKKKKVVRLIDTRTGEMKCNVCSAKKWVLKKNSKDYFRGSWKCQNECLLDFTTQT